MQNIYTLLDSGKTEDREEAYKHILVKQCNELGKIIPEMFEKISDYTELLLPDNLLEEGSIIRKMVEDIEEKDWKEEVEMIGWMYQYYISEKKDEIFAALKKNVKITKENIPAATQLFTPKWIVKYMVENSLGRLWLEGHPNEELQKEWKYYLEEAQQELEVEEELKKIKEEHSKLKPEDIKVLDPCMGSGHILVYAFDVLYEIYKTAGYSEREIPRMILKNNLYGLDIDDRAAQLASFALIMKARHYNRRLFREIEREHLELNLCSIQESNGITKEAIDYFVGKNEELRSDVEYLVEVFTDAKEYGSILEVEKVNFEALKQRLKEIEEDHNFTFGDYRKMLLDKLPMIIKQAEIMSRKYEVCVTNPPYMSSAGMNGKIFSYVKKNYNEGRNDLYTVFILKCMDYCLNGKYVSMITQQGWMSLTRSEKLREYIYGNVFYTNLVELGSHIFEGLSGEVVKSTAFVYRKDKNDNYLGIYNKLGNYTDSEQKRCAFLSGKNQYVYSMKNIKKIEGYPLSYWLSSELLNLFSNSTVSSNFICRAGMQTGNNEVFIRYWYEVEKGKLESITKSCDSKWYSYNKGGSQRKWYGNKELVVNWENNGKDIKKYKKERYEAGEIEKKNSECWNTEFYFVEGITWSSISSGTPMFRYESKESIFDIKGPTCFAKNTVSHDKLLCIMGYLNSSVARCLLQVLSPTLDCNPGTVSKLPYIDYKEENLLQLINKCIKISKKDWDSFETSWNFKVHPLLLIENGELRAESDEKNKKLSTTKYIADAFDVWRSFTDKQFEQLKYNEEELNRIFINIYGLQDELTPEVEDKNITIRKADRERDIKSFMLVENLKVSGIWMRKKLEE